MCSNCGGILIWQNDFSFDDYQINDRDGIVKVSLCYSCEEVLEEFIEL